jgi:hypothetical protein
MTKARANWAPVWIITLYWILLKPYHIDPVLTNTIIICGLIYIFHFSHDHTIDGQQSLDEYNWLI